MKRLISMIITIVFIGITLASIGFFYLSYQSDIREIDKKDEISIKQSTEKEKAREKVIDKEYQQTLATYEEEKRKAEEEGRILLKSEPLKPVDFGGFAEAIYTGADPKRANVNENFKDILIIHGVIIGFIILSEIGFLLILPKKEKTINVIIK